MQRYQQQFIEFLVESEALLFGDFTTKSGRKTPYFINTGQFNTGRKIELLGEFYATHIVESGLAEVDTIFGPAYKGVPLCVASSSALYRKFQREAGYTFNRKEAKTHGDKGVCVGATVQTGTSLVIVEDVITAGTTLKEIVPELRDNMGAVIAGVVIAVDRCECGREGISAVQEVEQELSIKVFPIVTIHDILASMKNGQLGSGLSDPKLVQKIESYLNQYGAKKDRADVL